MYQQFCFLFFSAASIAFSDSGSQAPAAVTGVAVAPAAVPERKVFRV